MRVYLLVLALGACITPPDNGGVVDPGGGWTGPGGGGITGCTQDSDCAATRVCARDGECLLPGDVRAIHISWTVEGAPASETTCASEPRLEIDFTGSSQGEIGYAPVPCREGKFSIDKMPIFYSAVSLSPEGATPSGYVAIDSQTGTAMIDLP